MANIIDNYKYNMTKKVDPILINGTHYVNLSDLRKLLPNKNLSKSSYKIIKTFNYVQDRDYYYFKLVETVWVPADGSSNRTDRSLLLLSVASRNKTLSEYINKVIEVKKLMVI